MKNVEIPMNEETGFILSEKIKIQEKKLEAQMGSIHSTQSATELYQVSRETYFNSALNSDIANKDIDDKIVVSQLPEQLKSVKEDLAELLTKGLPYKEFVEYRGLLKMIDKYEQKFSNDFGKNAFMINDISKFAETAVLRATGDKKYDSLTKHANELSPMEKASYIITTASSNMLTRINYAADSINTSVRSTALDVMQGYSDIQDGVKNGAIKLYSMTSNGIKAVSHKITDTVKEGLEKTREFGVNVLNGTKNLFLRIAKKGLIASFAGYQLTKYVAEGAIEKVGNGVDEVKNTTTNLKNYLNDQAHKGYNGAHQWVDKKVDSAMEAVFTAKAVGIEVKSAFNKLGEGLKSTGNNISENKDKLRNERSMRKSSI